MLDIDIPLVTPAPQKTRSYDNNCRRDSRKVEEEGGSAQEKEPGEGCRQKFSFRLAAWHGETGEAALRPGGYFSLQRKFLIKRLPAVPLVMAHCRISGDEYLVIKLSASLTLETI